MKCVAGDDVQRLRERVLKLGTFDQIQGKYSLRLPELFAVLCHDCGPWIAQFGNWTVETSIC